MTQRDRGATVGAQERGRKKAERGGSVEHDPGVGEAWQERDTELHIVTEAGQ